MPIAGVAGYTIPLARVNVCKNQILSADTREYWVSVLTNIAKPYI